MIKKWNKVQLGLMLIALPFVATAAASAHQWISSSAPIEAPQSVSEQVSADRIHQITLNSTGGIEGRIMTLTTADGEGLADLKVYFVRNGEVVKQASTDASGTFRIGNMSEGAYSFVATGKSGFAAYGVNVVANDGVATVNAMEAAAVSPRFSAVKEILTNNLPEQIAAEILEGESNITSELVGANRIQLQDGNLVGSIVPLFGEIANVEGTQVHIIKGDEQIAQVQADVNGAFSVANLEPGVYDFVAAGPTGIAAVSFQAIDAEGEIAASVMDSDEIPVAIEPAAAAAALPFQGSGSSIGGPAPFVSGPAPISADIPFDTASSLNVCTTCQADAGFVGSSIGSDVVYDQGYEVGEPIQYASESVSCGGACGSSCGTCGDFSNFSSCNTCGGGGAAATGGRGGLFGGRGGLLGGRSGGLLGGGGAGLSRLALLGGLAAAVAIPIAIGDDDDDGYPGYCRCFSKHALRVCKQVDYKRSHFDFRGGFFHALISFLGPSWRHV